MPRMPFAGLERLPIRLRSELGCTLQRLFSTFPDRWPGFGLLLLRLGMGIALIHTGVGSLSVETPAPSTVTQNVIAVGAGVFLLAGLWTPMMGALAAFDQVWIAVSLPSLHPIHIFLA